MLQFFLCYNSEATSFKGCVGRPPSQLLCKQPVSSLKFPCCTRCIHHNLTYPKMYFRSYFRGNATRPTIFASGYCQHELVSVKTRAKMQTLPRRRHLNSRGERSEGFILTHAARITVLTPLTRSLAVSEVEPSRVETQNKLNLQVSLKSDACGQKRFDSSRGRCAFSLIDMRLGLARRAQGPAEASSSRPPIHHFAHKNVCGGCNLIR